MNHSKPSARHSKLAALWVAAALGLAGAQLGAEERPQFSLGLEGGTTGFGPVLQYAPSERYNFALSYGYLDFDGENMKTKRTRYDADLTASNFAATVDWSPWGGHFHVTGGAVVYNHRFAVTARARKGNVYEIGDHDYTNAEITSVTGRVDTGTQVAPYIGVGWTWWFGHSGFGLHTNFGVMFTSSYDAKLSATGPLANDAVFLRDLRLEEDEMNDGFDVYPVAKVGFAYRF